jgi:hypothetical protein
MGLLIACLSPIGVIADQLLRAISNLALPDINGSGIPIRAVKTEPGQLYASPVGLQLAAIAKLPATQLSQRIVECLPNPAELQAAEQVLWDFQIWADHSGWIYARLSDSCIAAWLQRLCQSSPLRLSESENLQNLPIKPSPATSEAIFQLQYAHARCCSLIRLADREKLLDLQDPDPPHAPQFWQVIQPQPFPWLTAAGQLCCEHPSERALIGQLFEFPGLGQRSRCHTHAHHQDHLSVVSISCSRKQLLRQAQLWSDLILQFHRDCQILGAVKIEKIGLSQARLGLLIAAQVRVRFFLEDLLAVSAPLEL